MRNISASLLGSDFARLGEEVERAERAGADSLHFDIMDGYYVQNMALAPYHLRALRPYTRLPFITHLEVSDPIQIMKSFQGTDQDMIIVQADTCKDFRQVFKAVRDQGARIGLSLNPDDPLELARPYLAEIDLLLILAVMPGFGSQKMSPATPARIATASRMLSEAKIPSLPIGVDGGVNLVTAASLVEAGAEHLIAGTALFSAPDMSAVIRAFKAIPTRTQIAGRALRAM
jgi:ribulose-phosphate 3-epimerase